MVICGRSSAHMLDSLCKPRARRTTAYLLYLLSLYFSLPLSRAPYLLASLSLCVSLRLSASLRGYRTLLRPASPRELSTREEYTNLITPLSLSTFLFSRRLPRRPCTDSLLATPPHPFSSSFSSILIAPISGVYREINGDLLIEKLTRFPARDREKAFARCNSSLLASARARAFLPGRLLIKHVRARDIS